MTETTDIRDTPSKEALETAEAMHERLGVSMQDVERTARTLDAFAAPHKEQATHMERAFDTMNRRFADEQQAHARTAAQVAALREALDKASKAMTDPSGFVRGEAAFDARTALTDTQETPHED